jgi:SAM-dependent methyltransferase
MHEILRSLGPQARVLDIGSRTGSFAAVETAALTVRLDLAPANGCRGGEAAAADASRLPFPAAAFDAVIANHSLEHFEDLTGALQEIGRVLKPGGSLYVGVPDASTLTDKLYRWLARGGGHVNPFTSAEELARQISSVTGVRHYATRTLSTSLSFLNRRNMAGPAPLRIRWLVAFGEPGLAMLTALLRWIDAIAGTRLSVYGWALYFGEEQSVDCTRWTNACVRCGSSHPARQLAECGAVLRCFGWLPVFRCPTCGAANYFSQDSNS